MGLAVLPARLAGELPVLARALYSDADLTQTDSLRSHMPWLEKVRTRHPEANAENAETIIQQEIGAVFEQVLLDAGVFKRTDAGKAQFLRFVEQVRSTAD